jgi:hypothetical protein
LFCQSVIKMSRWWFNCSTFALQSSELWIKFTLFRALPMSSDLSCSDLLSPFLKARHIWTITMVTTKSKLQMEYNREVTSAAPGLVYVCFGSFVKYSRVWVIAGEKSNCLQFLWIQLTSGIDLNCYINISNHQLL